MSCFYEVHNSSSNIQINVPAIGCDSARCLRPFRPNPNVLLFKNLTPLKI